MRWSENNQVQSGNSQVRVRQYLIIRAQCMMVLFNKYEFLQNPVTLFNIIIIAYNWRQVFESVFCIIDWCYTFNIFTLRNTIKTPI